MTKNDLRNFLSLSLAALALLLAPGPADAQSPFFQAVTNLNPVAYWPLQETAAPPAADVETNLGSLGAPGNAYYSSTNVLKGITPGAIAGDTDAAVDFQSGLNGSFLAVPLTDPRVSLPVGPFTVEAWLNPTNSSASTVLAQTGVAKSGGLNNGSGSAGWSLNLGYIPSLGVAMPGTVSFHVYNGDGPTGGAEATYTSSTFVPNSGWYHVVGVFDGTNAMVYVNGTAGNSMAAMTGSQAQDTWDPLTLGCGRGLNNNRFGGSLDEVAIYTNALSSDRITAHYYAGIGGSGYPAAVLADNPYLYWRMDAPAYTSPDVTAYPPAANYGSADAGGLYLSGTTPGSAGPAMSGLDSPSYACAFNGIGTANPGALAYTMDGTPAFSGEASSGIFITNLDSGLNLASNSISLALWFKGNPADDRFQALAGHSDHSWRLAMGSGGNAGHLQWNFGAGSDLVSKGVYNDGQWHFAVAVYTNSDVPASPAGWLATNLLYVDGLLDNSALVTNLASLTSTTNVLLGGAPDYDVGGNGNVYRQRFFSGSLAHVAYFTNALSADQVAGLYAAAGGVPLPVITGQPISGRLNGAGGNNGSGDGSYLYFGVIARGATSYQWYFNASSNYSGATLLTDGDKYTNTATFNMTITNLADTDSGYYYVVAANSYGSVTSILASLQVAAEPFITSQSPAGSALELFPNQNYTFSVTATGETNFSYQWYTNGVADPVDGTNATYPVTAVQLGMSGNTYQCVVSNAVGAATNELVTLTVNPLPADITSSAYASALLAMNPSGYWPMHEAAVSPAGDVETNLGSLGSLANGYYADWPGSVVGTGIVHQVTGALAGDSDPAAGFNDTPNNTCPNYPGFLVIPRTSPATTLKPPFTIEAWAKPYSSGFGDMVSENGSENGVNNQNDGVRLSWGNNSGGSLSQGFQVWVGNGSARSSLPGGPSNFAIGQWYHVACTYDGTNWILYVNGSPVVTQPATAKYTLAPDTGSPIAIAQGLWGGSGPNRAFPGAIDEVAIYTNALDPAEIQRHYTAGTTAGASPSYEELVLATNPIVYLRMDAPAYTPPPLSTWAVMTNYGSVGGNGVYTPGSLLGAVSAPNATGLPGSVAIAGSGMSSFADAGFAPEFNPTTNAFSYSAWFKGNPADTRSFQTIVGHSDSSWRAAINSSGKLQAHAGGGDLTSSVMCNDGNWHQFVMTFSGTNAATLTPGTNILYLDGVPVATGTGAGNPGSTLDVMFGNDPQYTNSPYGIGRCFAGSVCEVAFWDNVALSQEQVTALWNAAGIPPYITAQPVDANLNQGIAFTNQIQAGGSATLTYQWYKDGTALGGQTSSELVLNPVRDTNTGNYFVVVTNNFGAVTSSVVNITVFSSPFIESQAPVPYANPFTLFAGATPTFSLLSVAGAQPLHYQWYTNGVADPGGTSASYTLSNLQVGSLTSYCIVTNTAGAATSFVWTASIIAPPTAPFAQSVMGLNPLGYWRLNEPDDGLNDGNPGAIAHDYVGGNDGIYTNVLLGQPGYSQRTDPGTTSAAFGTLSTFDSTVFNIDGIDFASPTNTTRSFSIAAWVNAAPSQISGAGILSKGYGNGGEQFNLDIYGGHYRFFVRDASGGVHGPTTSVFPDGNWHYLVGICDEASGSVSLYIDGLLAGQSSIPSDAGIIEATNLMSIGARRSSASTNDYDFQLAGYVNDVAVYGYALSSDQVQSSYFSTGVAPIITQEPPANASASEGGNLTVSATAIGSSPLAYQWIDTQNSPLFASQTNATLSLSNIPASLNGDNFYLTVTNLYGSTNSGYTTLLVVSGAPQLTASNLPPQVLLPSGKSYTYSVQAIGSLPFSYQWYAAGTPLAGQTSSSFTVTAGATGSTNFSVTITNTYGSISGSSLLTIVPMPTDPYATNLLGLNPVGYWPLQESNPPAPVTMETNLGTLGALGNAYYAVTNSTDVAFAQGGALTASGDTDTAATFNGAGNGGKPIDGYAFVPHVTPALTVKPPMTYEAWIYSSSTGFGDIMGEGGSGLNTAPNSGTFGGIRLSYGGNNGGGPNLQVYSYNGNGGNFDSFGTPAGSLPINQWHHCVLTYDGTDGILYIDGQPRATNALRMVLDAWSPITIGTGRWQGAPTRGFVGTVDEVAVYTNVLPASRVLAHYTAGTSATGSSYVQSVQADQPLLYYRMDAQGFVVPDPSQYPVAVNYGSAPVNGLYPGGVPPGGVSGPVIPGLSPNLAAPINGVFSGIDAGNDPAFDPAGTQPFSVLLWFRGYPADGRVQTLMSHGVNNWALNLDGTTGRIVWNLGTAGNVTSTNILNDGNWHQVAGVYDGATSSLYVDGVLNSSASAGGSLTDETNAELFIGGNVDYTTAGSTQRFLAGAVSQVALFNSALTAAQVQFLFSIGTAPATPTLTLEQSANGPVINYTGTLLSAPNVSGPYNPVPGAQSPYPVPETQNQQFYRSRNP